MAPEANDNAAEKKALDGAGNEKHAVKENALGDRQAQQQWEKADAEASKNDKTPSQLDMKAISEPLLLFDKTQSGSHKILVSSAESNTHSSGSKSRRSADISSPGKAYEKSSRIGEEELNRLAGNDMTAAGYLRELNEAKQLLEGKALEAREKQIWQLVHKTYGYGDELRPAEESKTSRKVNMKDSNVNPLSNENGDGGPAIKAESKKHLDDTGTIQNADKHQINTAEIKALAESDETARSVAEMLDSLDGIDLENDEKQRLRSTIKAGFTDVCRELKNVEPGESDAVDDKQQIRELQPQKIDGHTFALGLEYNADVALKLEAPTSSDGLMVPGDRATFTNPSDALHRFGQAAFSRAAEALTDHEQQFAFWQAQQGKLIGICEGLNLAKESLKDVVKSTAHYVQSGELAEFLAKPNAINEPLARAASAALAAMEADPQAINKAMLAGLQTAGVITIESSEKYSAMSPREQGRVIGEAMFSFINPEGSLEAPQLLNQATKRSDEAIQAALQAAMKSGTAEEIKGNLQLLRDFATSPELKEFFRDSVKVQAADFHLMPAGVPPELYSELEQQIYFMNKADSGDGSWWDKTYRRFRELAGQSEKAVAKSADDSVESILELEGEAFITRAVDKIVQPIDSSSPAFTHWQRMKEVLKTIPEEDIRTLAGADWKFYFPRRLEDVDKRLAKTARYDDNTLHNETLVGVTDVGRIDKEPQRGRSIVPFERWCPESGTFIPNNTGADLAGVTRHEIGHVLNSIHHWYCRPGVKYIYDNCVASVKEEIQQLEELVLRHPESIAARKTLITAQNDAQFLKQHLRPRWEYGLEQTLADLYAISLEGCGHPKRIEALLEERFAELKIHMQKNNWFRQAGEKK